MQNESCDEGGSEKRHLEMPRQYDHLSNLRQFLGESCAVVSKKSGITVIKNDADELIPTQSNQDGERVLITESSIRK